MKRVLILLLLLSLMGLTSASAATVKGGQGQKLTTSKSVAKNGSTITVTGNHFDETVGIYLSYCVIQKKGVLPSPCGGGINKAGVGDASFWISSNPPPYGVGLAQEFLPGGRFTQRLQVTRKIGKFDCKKVICAVTVRADHLRGNDRSYDLFIPIKIK
jgi:hypothetical protein